MTSRPRCKNYLAKPSPLDRTRRREGEAVLARELGGLDAARALRGGAASTTGSSARSREKPEDYLRAFLQIDADYRALLLFTYQSYLWNEGVRRLLQLVLPREQLFPLRYQAGTLLFHRDGGPETLRCLREPHLPAARARHARSASPRSSEAVEWVLGKEKLRLEELRIPRRRALLFFKHEERAVLVHPDKLVLGRTQPDELNRGYAKLNVAFTLPPGSYATLVIKRLFHRTAREDTPEEIQASARSARPGVHEADTRPPDTRSARPPRRPGGRRASAGCVEAGARAGPRAALRPPRSDPSQAAEPGKTGSLRPGPGFRALAKARKEAKVAARARQKLR